MGGLKRCKWCLLLLPQKEAHLAECKFCRVDGPFRPHVEMQTEAPQDDLPLNLAPPELSHERK